jgi:hypothetical protein
VPALSVLGNHRVGFGVPKRDKIAFGGPGGPYQPFFSLFVVSPPAQE